MKYGLLGNSDIKVSRIAMGCFAFAGGQTWGPQDETASIATLEAALEAGITFFDTAEMYGDGYSEELLGKVLSKHRDKIVIASKASSENLAPAALKAACERSLRRLKTDYLDLYQIHWPNWNIPLEDTIGALEHLKSQGMIRAIGVSNFGKQDLTECLDYTQPITNQVPYNLLWRAIEYDILPLCEQHGIGILSYSPLMQGLLTGKFKTADDVPEGRARTRHFSGSRGQARHGETGQEAATFSTLERLQQVADRLEQPLNHLALAYLLQQKAVSSVLVGARTPAQLGENLKALELNLAEATLSELSELTEPLKTKLGANPDMWNASAASRYR